MGAHASRDADIRDVLDALRRIVQMLRESSRLAEKHVGLSGAQLFVLHQLAGEPHLALKELAARTHTHQSSVSTVVSRLVEAGLVSRARSGRDGRSVALSLTARGRTLVGRSPDAGQDRLIRAVESLPASRRADLARALRHLGHAVDSTRRRPEMFFEERKRTMEGRRTS